jgi:transposase
VTDKELDKNAARRLAIIRHAQEVTGNVAMTCRYYGISRQVFYTWYRRYQTEGLAGLRDRSRRPLHCPHETPAEVVGKIIYLRTNYHFGPAKISMYLKRYHDIEISTSGVWRILKGSTSAGSRPTSATSATTASGSGTRSHSPGTRSRST